MVPSTKGGQPGAAESDEFRDEAAPRWAYLLAAR